MKLSMNKFKKRNKVAKEMAQLIQWILIPGTYGKVGHEDVHL